MDNDIKNQNHNENSKEKGTIKEKIMKGKISLEKQARVLQDCLHKLVLLACTSSSIFGWVFL